MSNPALSPIYERLNGAGGYHPFTANTFTDWSSEAGDTVTISRNGTEYAAPIHKQTITWRGQPRVTMEAGGNKEREPTERVSDRKFKSTKSAARTNSGKTHTFEVNDQYFLYEIDNPNTGIKTRLQVAENDITAEVTRATAAEGGLRTDVASLQVTIDGITQTVGTIETEVDTLDGKVTTIEGSALWTQRNNITGVVGEFDVVTDAQTGTKTLVVKSGGGLNIRRNGAEFGVYDDGTLTAGVIATKVNGVASTNIYGSNIVMSSTDSTPVTVEIAGKLTAEDITANFLNAKIATIPTLTGIAGHFSGNVVSDSAIIGTGIYIGSTAPYSSVSDAITQLQVVETSSGSGVYKIQKKDFDDSGWVDVPGTFSRATTLSGGWGSGTFTVTATPQGNTISTQIVQGAATWSGNTATVPIEAIDSDNPGYQYATGRNISVNATERYNAGWDYAITQRVVSAASTTDQQIKTLDFDEKWKVTFTIPDSSGTNVTSSYVVKGPSDPYTLASVTLQGSAISGSVYHTIPTGGTVYYTAGTAVTKYDRGSKETYYRGNGTRLAQITSTTTVYDKGGNETYYRGNGAKFTHYFDGRVYYYDGSGSLNYLGNGYWYACDTRNAGETLYERGGSVTVNQATNGRAVKLASSSVTVYQSSSTGSDYLRGGTVDVYQATNGASIMPIGSSSLRLEQITTGAYRAGSTVTDTYYTKS